MVPCLPQRDGNRWLDAINKNAYEIIFISNLNLNKLGILWKFKEFLRKTEQPKNDELDVEFHIPTAALHTTQQTPKSYKT